MSWFIGAAWIPKCDGEKVKFVEWWVQVEAILMESTVASKFCFGALEVEAKYKLQFKFNPRDKNTGQKVLDILQYLYAKSATKAQLQARFCFYY